MHPLMLLALLGAASSILMEPAEKALSRELRRPRTRNRPWRRRAVRGVRNTLWAHNRVRRYAGPVLLRNRWGGPVR